MYVNKVNINQTEQIYDIASVDSYESNDASNIESAKTHVMTDGGNAIKPMTDFNSVFDADGKSLTDKLDTLSSNISEVDNKVGDIIGQLDSAIDSSYIECGGKNMLNPNAFVEGARLISTNGKTYQAENYSYSDYIDVSENSNIIVSASVSITSGFVMCLYGSDNEDAFVSGASIEIETLDEALGRYYVSLDVANAAFVRLSMPTNIINIRRIQIEKGMTPTEYEEYSEKKKEYVSHVKESAMPESYNNKIDKEDGKGLSTNDFTNEDKQNVSSITEGFDVVIIPETKSINIFDISKCIENTRILSNSGAEYQTSGYMASDFIDVTNSENIIVSGSVNVTSGHAYALYNASKTYLRGGTIHENMLYDSDNKRYYKVIDTNGVNYFRFSSNQMTTREWMVAKGGISLPYDDYYFYPKKRKVRLKEDKLPMSWDIIKTNSLTNGYRATRQTFVDGETISFDSNSIKKNNHFAFYAKISSFNAIIVGQGTTSKGYCIKIDNEKVYPAQGVEAFNNGSPHNLNINTYIAVSIDVDYEYHAKIIITTLGGRYEYNLTGNSRWGGGGAHGEIFAMCVGSMLTSAALSWTCDDYSKNIWAFGDSYFSFHSTARWLYYLLVERRIDNVLVNGYPGQESASAYEDFLSAKQKGTPQFLLWCQGMNNPDNGSINQTWLNVVRNLELYCEENGVELILATIPCCPTFNHSYKNAWIKASGHRYIDFAEAVGAEVEGSTWIPGTRYSEEPTEVHPSEEGAKLLYHKAITDFPEIVVNK